MIKEWFKNVLATTAITLIIVTLVGVATGDDSIKTAVILPCVAANALIHLGIYGIRRLACEYLLAELLMELGFVIGIMLLTGSLAGWFARTSPWATVGITVAVFFVACLVDIVRLNKEVEQINRDIEDRREALALCEETTDADA